MLLKFVIDLIIDNDEDEELKDFAGDFLDTNSTVSNLVINKLF